MSYQLARIDYEKNRALEIFTSTRDRFMRAIERAKKYIEDNDQKIVKLKGEMMEVDSVNDTLKNNINVMQDHVTKINHLIGE